MSIKPRTIDNLGIESSSRYAKDKEALVGSKLIEDSRFIPLKTEVSAVKPYIPSDLEEYLLPSKLVLWALFDPPPDYMSHSAALFSFQLVPSIGSYEKQEEDIEKLEALEDTLKKRSRKKKGPLEQDDEDERKRQKLLAFLKMMGSLDRNLSFINARRHQYQRG